MTKVQRHRQAYNQGVELSRSGQEYRNKYSLSDMLEYHSFHAGWWDAEKGYV